MLLHIEQPACNAVDLVDEEDNLVASVNGTDEGVDDITPREVQIAEILCSSFNNSAEAELL